MDNWHLIETWGFFGSWIFAAWFAAWLALVVVVFTYYFTQDESPDSHQVQFIYKGNDLRIILPQGDTLYVVTDSTGTVWIKKGLE